MLKRVFLFMAVNLLILVTISVVTALLGVNQYLTGAGLDYQKLLVLCLVWGMGASLMSLAISRWAAKFMMGVQVLQPGAGDADERWLVQTVHHLAKQAGMTVMPEVGFYESGEVNAFATGPTRNRALVAVSTGLMQRMEKSQIEGVLGHEISH